MSVTLRWLIEGSTLENLRCVACPELLSHTVSSVNIIDNPDVVKWLKQDELVLTSGYLLLDHPEAQKQLIRDLKAEGCAALGIKVHRYFLNVPQVMIEEAERIRFPLIELPFFYAFSDVSRVVYNRIYAQSTLTARKEQRLLSALTALLFNGEPLEEMVRTIARYTHTAAAVVDLDGCVLEQHSAMPEEQLLPEVLPSFQLPEDGASIELRCTDHWKRLCCIHLPGAHGVLLLLERVPFDAAERSTLRRAASILSLKLERHRFELLMSVEQSNGFFDTLAAGTQVMREEEMIQICEANHFDYQKKRICLTLFSTNEETFSRASPCMQQIETAVASFCHQSSTMWVQPFCCGDNTHHCIYLLCEPAVGNSELTALARQLSQQLTSLLSAQEVACICVSRCHQSLQNIRGAFQECISLQHLMHPMFPQRRCFYHMGATPFRLLRMASSDELRQIYLDTIEPLERFDRENQGELLQTLTAYYQCQFNAAQTAKKLFVHRNTLLHRLDKIKDLLHNDLQEMDDCMSIYLGLCVSHILY